jgi:hypothetical protein
MLVDEDWAVEDVVGFEIAGDVCVLALLSGAVLAFFTASSCVWNASTAFLFPTFIKLRISRTPNCSLVASSCETHRHSPALALPSLALEFPLPF